MSFEQRNVVGIETPWGYKSFHLFEGSLTLLNFSANVLVVSVAESDYRPLEGTVAQALLNDLGVDLGQLAQNPVYDLRSEFGCWVSEPVNTDAFGRILCVELKGTEASLEMSFENLFVTLGVMEAKGITIQNLVCPVLGGGSLALDPTLIIEVLMPRALAYMRRSSTLEEFVFVEANGHRAELLDEAMNRHLGRVKINLPKGKLIQSLTSEILATLDRAGESVDAANERALGDLRRVISRESPKSFEIGVSVRRLAEIIVRDLEGKRSHNSLYKSIEGLHDDGIAKWIISYLHTMRVFGNEAAHVNSTDRLPPHVDAADLAITLFCTARVLDCWQNAEALSPSVA